MNPGRFAVKEANTSTPHPAALLGDFRTVSPTNTGLVDKVRISHRLDSILQIFFKLCDSVIAVK